MKRIKRHKVKTETPGTSTSYNREQEVHDLAYYIHDRVELMHQVFSVIKYKELKAMVPASIRNISLDDLQELCTEELLGISSKRLCAILDGADPPSDTESSSPSPPPEQMETISLDSISSDDEILSQASNKKKKHKHRRHSSKTKSKRKKSREQESGEAERSAASRAGLTERGQASRAGLTVLELLELQARARAIRAQLQQEQLHKPVSEVVSKEPPHSSDNEVEIKEEPAEVVEISSDEEKPKVEDLQKKITQEKDPEPHEPPVAVTKRINDLVITVPQKTKQKIKLNRTKSTPTPTENFNSVAITQKTNDSTQNVATVKNVDKTPENRVDDTKTGTAKKDKSKKKKKDKKSVSKDDIDNDEITLQLSDTEKMDLLEDLDRKHYDSVSSCSETSSESSSDSDEPQKDKEKESSLKEENITPENSKDCEKKTIEPEKKDVNSDKKDSVADDNNKDEILEKTSELEKDSSKKTDLKSSDIDNTSKEDKMESDIVQIDSETEKNPEIDLECETVEKTDSNKKDSDNALKDTVVKDTDTPIHDIPTVATKDKKDDVGNEPETKSSDKELSEGELSDRESSEIEAVDLKPEVVCISDEEGGKKGKKKKKKKEKKSKKAKKSKKSDFRESADQNFYKDDIEVIEESTQEELQKQGSIQAIDNTTQSDSPSNDAPVTKNTDKLLSTEIIDKVDLTAAEKPVENKNKDTETIKEEIVDNDKSPAALLDSDIEAVYEIMELSDDSSCCEVECTILSKEPTASEIEALSAKIDEIDRVEIITDKEIREYEKMQQENTGDLGDIENISWKDRYLDSKKVKKVLNTANILNALRKKNIDLKKKLAESKKEAEESVPEEKVEEEEQNVLEEGSIEQFNTLEALNKYVDPVKEVSKDLKKDAKLLLRMYKKLLKYNDMNKPEDLNKKRKKKRKKSKKESKIKGDICITKDKEDYVPNVEDKEVSAEDKEDLNKEVHNLVPIAENIDDCVANAEVNLDNKEENVVLTEDLEKNDVE